VDFLKAGLPLRWEKGGLAYKSLNFSYDNKPGKSLNTHLTISFELLILSSAP
jgi:hypothetical protein